MKSKGPNHYCKFHMSSFSEKKLMLLSLTFFMHKPFMWNSMCLIAKILQSPLHKNKQFKFHMCLIEKIPQSPLHKNKQVKFHFKHKPFITDFLQTQSIHMKFYILKQKWNNVHCIEVEQVKFHCEYKYMTWAKRIHFDKTKG